MNSPQPPDPWQSQPSMPEDDVYEPDPDDADAVPLQVPAPRRADDWDSGRDRRHPRARELHAAS
jgi:hypothetical protein